MNKEVTTTDEADTLLRDRKPIRVDPTWIVMQASGFAWNEYQVRLPADAVFSDLADPKIWAAVQMSSVSLRRHDKLYIVAFDEGWSAEARVIGASDSGATISKPSRIDMNARTTEALLEDNFHRVVWNGRGFEVRRKADNQRMCDTLNSRSAAERLMDRLHPRPVS